MLCSNVVIIIQIAPNMSKVLLRDGHPDETLKYTEQETKEEHCERLERKANIKQKLRSEGELQTEFCKIFRIRGSRN